MDTLAYMLVKRRPPSRITKLNSIVYNPIHVITYDNGQRYNMYTNRTIYNYVNVDGQRTTLLTAISDNQFYKNDEILIYLYRSLVETFDRMEISVFYRRVNGFTATRFFSLWKGNTGCTGKLPSGR